MFSPFSASLWIREKTKEAVLEPEFLSELSKKVRPSVIIDVKGTVLGDQGAIELLESLKVDNSEHLGGGWENAYPWKITVNSKKPLSHAPRRWERPITHAEAPSKSQPTPMRWTPKTRVQARRQWPKGTSETLLTHPTAPLTPNRAKTWGLGTGSICP